MRMKSKALALILALAMVLSLAVPAFAADADDAAASSATVTIPEAGEGDIVILHSNDVHGAIEGYATMAALKAYYQELGAEVLLVDAGDYIQGTTYVSVSQGATAIEMMNLAGYDYAAVGNHEFDYGYANLAELAPKAEFEILSANTLYNGKAAFGDHAVVTLGDVKVGIFGMETPETATKAHPAKIQGVTFLAGEELYACAQAEVDALKAAGCDYIIGLGHLGVDDETKATANRSIDMLVKVTGIDVFIDAHSHSTISVIEEKIAAEGGSGNKVGDTLVTSTGTKFANFGVVVIAADGTITTNLISAEDAAKVVTPDAKVAARAAEIIAEIEAIYGATFATTEVRLNGDRDPGNRTEETNLGNLITDAMLWYATKDGGLEVEDDYVVAVTNGGGIRATIEAGDITMNDINTVLPFGNTVAIVYVDGASLLEALEASTYSTPTAVGGFPQVSGIEFTINTEEEFDQGDLYPGSTYYQPNSISRVTINSINGKDFNPEATYAVVTNDFCAAGGDTYYAFKVAPNVMDTGVPMDEAVMAYITEELDSVVTAEKYGKTEGRITIGEFGKSEAPAGTFIDVAADAWYAEAVNYVVEAQIMNGVPGGKFDPAGTVTRGTLMTMLARYAGEDTTPAAGEAWYQPGMDWAVEAEISDGTAPERAITRQEVAALLYRYVGSPEAEADLSAFTDADSIADWAEDAMVWAVANGILQGSNNALNPAGTATRDVIAQIMMNFCVLAATAEAA